MLAELLTADGAEILAPRLRREVRTLAPLLEEYGEPDVGSIKAVLVRAMITGGRVGHVRSWAYFRPVIAQEGGRPWEVRKIGAPGAGGTLSRCLADVEADRRDREARAARASASAAEPVKACRSCLAVQRLHSMEVHVPNKAPVRRVG